MVNIGLWMMFTKLKDLQTTALTHIWDTFRGTHPLLTIIDQKHTQNLQNH